MLIRANHVTFNVKSVRQIVVSPEEHKKRIPKGWFAAPEYQTTYTYTVGFYYDDIENKPRQFEWTNFTREQALRIETELLQQIKETELEKMSSALEEAINNG